MIEINKEYSIMAFPIKVYYDSEKLRAFIYKTTEEIWKDRIAVLFETVETYMSGQTIHFRINHKKGLGNLALPAIRPALKHILNEVSETYCSVAKVDMEFAGYTRNLDNEVFTIRVIGLDRELVLKNLKNFVSDVLSDEIRKSPSCILFGCNKSVITIHLFSEGIDHTRFTSKLKTFCKTGLI